MSTSTSGGTGTTVPDPRATVGTTTGTEPSARALSPAARYLLAALRLSLGWIFLWAFLDKTWGLGFATPAENAWVEGGSPTSGYLGNAVSGPFADFYNGLAGEAWVDWLFMIGLLGIGLALILGIGMRIAAVTGTLLLVMMWTAVLPPENNPFMDDHLIYALVIVLLAVVGAGRFLGLAAQWERLAVVQKAPFLK
jgi:thiosulfate dehydrogenase [quinone] large subunit